jgi:hypothetical protein
MEAQVRDMINSATVHDVGRLIVHMQPHFQASCSQGAPWWYKQPTMACAYIRLI